MRSTLAIATIAAAAAAVSAQNCNPSYNVAGSGDCFTNCNINAGQDFVPGWTMDHASPKFLDSLKLMCTKGTSEYMAFMTKAGMCMAGCSDPQELFINEFAGACSWYAAHKDDVCGAEPAPVTPPASTTTPPAATTTPPVAGTTTNVPIHTGAPVPSSGSSTPPAAASSGAAAVSNNGTVPAASGASSPAASGAPGASGASGAQPAASASAGGANNQAQQPPNAANKLSMGGFVIAMIASAGYLAL